MKVLSIRQPWAWLIVNGHKDIENRTWTTRFRGPIPIQASKGMTLDEYNDVDGFLGYNNKKMGKDIIVAISAERGGEIMNKLSPLHRSIRGERNKFMPRFRPQNMERIGVTEEQRLAMEQVALDIFTDMTNAGCSLQETLSAIYMSGIQHALSMTTKGHL